MSITNILISLTKNICFDEREIFCLHVGLSWRQCNFFKESIDSLLAQTRKPDEIVLVVDGPVGDDN